MQEGRIIHHLPIYILNYTEQQGAIYDYVWIGEFLGVKNKIAMTKLMYLSYKTVLQYLILIIDTCRFDNKIDTGSKMAQQEDHWEGRGYKGIQNVLPYLQLISNRTMKQSSQASGFSFVQWVLYTCLWDQSETKMN